MSSCGVRSVNIELGNTLIAAPKIGTAWNQWWLCSDFVTLPPAPLPNSTKKRDNADVIRCFTCLRAGWFSLYRVSFSLIYQDISQEYKMAHDILSLSQWRRIGDSHWRASAFASWSLIITLDETWYYMIFYSRILRWCVRYRREQAARHCSLISALRSRRHARSRLMWINKNLSPTALLSGRSCPRAISMATCRCDAASIAVAASHFRGLRTAAIATKQAFPHSQNFLTEKWIFSTKQVFFAFRFYQDILPYIAAFINNGDSFSNISTFSCVDSLYIENDRYYLMKFWAPALHVAMIIKMVASNH